MNLYRRHPHTAGRAIDGQAFIVTPDDNKLHTLNASATELWRLCEEGLSSRAAGLYLAATYEIDPDTAQRDAKQCLNELVSRQILVLHPAADSPSL